MNDFFLKVRNFLSQQIWLEPWYDDIFVRVVYFAKWMLSERKVS
jgi:hypothetical protein